MSDSLWPHGPSRLLCPWGSPSKNTGVGCHFLLQGSSQISDLACVSCIGRQILYHWATSFYFCVWVIKSCPTLCNPMDCSTPGSSVLHHLLELAQIHVHWVGDAIQPFHPLSPPSPPALNLSQHQGLFQWVSSLHHVAESIRASASILPMNIQGWFPLGLTGLISLLSKGLGIILTSHIQIQF